MEKKWISGRLYRMGPTIVGRPSPTLYGGREQPGGVRKQVLIARYSRLASIDNLCRWFKDYVCANCVLCGAGIIESPSHMSLECTHDSLHAQHINRHTGWSTR